MRFIKKNIFMILFFLFVAPSAFYIVYNRIYKPYDGNIAPVFKIDNSASKKSIESAKELEKQKKESENIVTNKKQEDELPKINKETIETTPSTEEKNVKNENLSLGEKDIFASLDSGMKNSNQQPIDDKTNTKIDPNIASDDIFQDMMNDGRTSSRMQEDFNIELPEDNNEKNKKENNSDTDLVPSPSENISDDKTMSEVTRELDHKDTQSLPPVLGDNIVDDMGISEMNKQLESQSQQKILQPSDDVSGEGNKEAQDKEKILQPSDDVLGEGNKEAQDKEKILQPSDDVSGESIKPSQDKEKILQPSDDVLGESIKPSQDKEKILQPSDDVLGENATTDLNIKDIKRDSQENKPDTLPETGDNILEENSEKSDAVSQISTVEKQSQAQKEALEKLPIAEDLFSISPSPDFQGIIPDPVHDKALAQASDNKPLAQKQNKISAQVDTKDDIKNNLENKHPPQTQDKVGFQPIKLGSAECVYEHEIDSRKMQETFRLMIVAKENEKPLTMEVTRQLELLDYVTMTTDDIDGYPDSFTQLSVFCNRMSVRKILNEDYPNISLPVSSSTVPSP